MAKRADLERAALLAKGEDPKGDDPDRDVGSENAMRAALDWLRENGVQPTDAA